MGKELEIRVWIETEEGPRSYEGLTEAERLLLARIWNEKAAEALDMELKESQPAAACSRDSSV